ncbi:MAG: MerR family transcriptional regulator [Muribaculaceae bacterium]|nr:MerR family transcriptional regulator [Muribaculaceae bacterium]
MDELDKQYYKIRDVAEMLGVPASTLRYWEKEFPQCAPRRSAGNVRYYKPADIEQLRIIKYLVKDKGLKIEAAKEQLRVNSGNVSRQQAVIERLQSVRDRLEELRKALNIRK